MDPLRQNGEFGYREDRTAVGRYLTRSIAEKKTNTPKQGQKLQS